MALRLASGRRLHVGALPEAGTLTHAHTPFCAVEEGRDFGQPDKVGIWAGPAVIPGGALSRKVGIWASPAVISGDALLRVLW